MEGPVFYHRRGAVLRDPVFPNSVLIDHSKKCLKSHFFFILAGIKTFYFQNWKSMDGEGDGVLSIFSRQQGASSFTIEFGK